MATPKAAAYKTGAPSTAVDLFGNSALSPRDVMQQQLEQAVQQTAAQTVNQGQNGQSASMLGAATSGLLSQILIKQGILPKPPEVQRAENLQQARDNIQKDAAEKGINPQTDPSGFADLAVSHFLRAGDEQAAMMAMNWKHLQETNKRVADKERAGIEDTQSQTIERIGQSGYTPESIQKFKTSGNYSDLVTDPNGAGKRSPYFSDVDLADGTKATLNQRNGQYIDPSTGKAITDPKRLRGAKFDPKLHGDLKFAEESGSEGSKNLFAQRQLATDALTSLNGTREVRKLLDDGMKTGKFANFEAGLGATLNSVGIKYKENEVENTQAFIAAQSKQVAQIIKAFGSGTGLSDADREFAIKAAGGDITFNEASIRKVLDINDRASNNVLKRYKDLYGKVRKDYLPYAMDVETPPPEAPAKPAAALPKGWTVKAK